MVGQRDAVEMGGGNSILFIYLFIFFSGLTFPCKVTVINYPLWRRDGKFTLVITTKR